MTGHRCHEKIPHRSRGAALAALAKMTAAGKGNPDLGVYRCGDHWHVGHNLQHFRNRIKTALRGTPKPRRRA